MAEVGAFRKLVSFGKPLPTLIGFYGSYVQDGTYNVILEYIDQGNLEQYFENTAPPSSGKDIIHFWRGLFGIIQALDRIHELPPTKTGGLHFLQGWHQDVKPPNILIGSGDSKSPYCYQFKLGDLGLSHFKENTKPRKELVTDADSYGTRAYGAPECYRWDSYIEKARLDVYPSVDIWSLGCVFSEAAVWVVSGMEGLQRYRLQRDVETKCFADFKDGNCFHNGEDTLKAVESMHVSLREDIRHSDHVTNEVWNIMIKEMLEFEAHHRPNTKQLLRKSKRILDEAEKMLSPANSYLPLKNLRKGEANLDTESTLNRNNLLILRPRSPPEPPTTPEETLPHTPEETLPPTPQDRDYERWIPESHIQGSHQPVLNQPLGAMTYDRIIRVNRPSNKPPLPFLSVTSARQEIAKNGKWGLKIMLARLGLDVQLRSRDHAFLVDDSGSMKSHWADVLELFKIMAYIVKDFDKNGIELQFFKSPNHYQEKNTTPLLTSLRYRTLEGYSDVKPPLNSILYDYQKKLNSKPLLGIKYLSKPVRPLNLYIFTDGAWLDDEDIERPIKNLVGEVEKLKFPGDQIGIQFIRFGNDRDGERRLKFLDSGLHLSL
ncbi:MAG: hypothetical protein Q9187_001163, partial [Circinaria calcarea]